MLLAMLQASEVICFAVGLLMPLKSSDAAVLSMLCRWLVSTSYRVLSYKDPVPSKSKPKLSTLHHVVRSVALLKHDAALLGKANHAILRFMDPMPSKSKPQLSTAHHVV